MSVSYQINLPQFEGPFDLLLFFIERDELDIYNIPITRIINDFLAYIHAQESLNIELSSEFILFISTLMRIKAKMLLPRKELDAHGAEIDPRQELIDKVLEYKRYKEVAAQMAELEAERQLMIRRGNIQKELSGIGEEAGEGTEIQAITLFKLMKAFEKAMQRYADTLNKPTHTVVRYNYSIGIPYTGRFGPAYKLHGLEASNRTAFERFVVLHGHQCVPATETGDEICQSDGCPTVAPAFLKVLGPLIRKSAKPVLLWIFE